MRVCKVGAKQGDKKLTEKDLKAIEELKKRWIDTTELCEILQLKNTLIYHWLMVMTCNYILAEKEIVTKKAVKSRGHKTITVYKIITEADYEEVL